mmetsp:Transcript_14424/g.31277  ORF Transcript_14424/g.31277 Transcript_14424/m.31277 type:complete len:201 (-) Transcript_14424:987-1589(-)
MRRDCSPNPLSFTLSFREFSVAARSRHQFSCGHLPHGGGLHTQRFPRPPKCLGGTRVARTLGGDEGGRSCVHPFVDDVLQRLHLGSRGGRLLSHHGVHGLLQLLKCARPRVALGRLFLNDCLQMRNHFQVLARWLRPLRLLECGVERCFVKGVDLELLRCHRRPHSLAALDSHLGACLLHRNERLGARHLEDTIHFLGGL